MFSSLPGPCLAASSSLSAVVFAQAQQTGLAAHQPSMLLPAAASECLSQRSVLSCIQRRLQHASKVTDVTMGCGSCVGWGHIRNSDSSHVCLGLYLLPGPLNPCYLGMHEEPPTRCPTQTQTHTHTYLYVHLNTYMHICGVPVMAQGK